PHTLFHFFYHDTPTTHLYTLSLHDALPIYSLPLPFGFWVNSIILEFCYGMLIALAYREGFRLPVAGAWALGIVAVAGYAAAATPDRKSTRLNSSHRTISYAVFCLKKKKKKQ